MPSSIFIFNISSCAHKQSEEARSEEYSNVRLFVYGETVPRLELRVNSQFGEQAIERGLALSDISACHSAGADTMLIRASDHAWTLRFSGGAIDAQQCRNILSGFRVPVRASDDEGAQAAKLSQLRDDVFRCLADPTFREEVNQIHQMLHSTQMQCAHLLGEQP
jgi:hypothetical protein